MSYSLTLSHGERAAFDWVGSRYSSTGSDMKELIVQGMPSDQEWDDPSDITFIIPESVSWEMKNIAEEEEFLWPCFSSRLAAKMNQFLDNII